jgi:hypothetical protein
MNTFLEILKYILPSLIVFGTAYLIIRSFIDNDQKKRKLEIRLANQKTITPIKLQAYERLTLLLERISPESMIVRIQDPKMTAGFLHKALLKVIRTEFEHNLSQQIYVSGNAWSVVKTAKENVVKLVNSSADKVDPKAASFVLSKLILETMMDNNITPTQVAIDFLKHEAGQYF